MRSRQNLPACVPGALGGMQLSAAALCSACRALGKLGGTTAASSHHHGLQSIQECTLGRRVGLCPAHTTGAVVACSSAFRVQHAALQAPCDQASSAGHASCRRSPCKPRPHGVAPPVWRWRWQGAIQVHRGAAPVGLVAHAGCREQRPSCHAAAPCSPAGGIQC